MIVLIIYRPSRSTSGRRAGRGHARSDENSDENGENAAGNARVSRFSQSKLSEMLAIVCETLAKSWPKL
jgi:hypothetical protein